MRVYPALVLSGLNGAGSFGKDWLSPWRRRRYNEITFSQPTIVMALSSDRKTTIIRTERGLTISGTRITLYDIMDYVTAQYPPKFIRSLFNLTDEQINTALAYIEENRSEVEAEYQQVLKETEELRQYYEEQNRERVARSSAQSPKPGTEAAWEKLRVAKAKRNSKV